jgi:cytochrome c oxidase subunit 3
MNFFKELTDKSWATPGVVPEIYDRSLGEAPAYQTCLNTLLAVLSSMFFLFIAGYRLRMAEADWVPINDPGVLWLNLGFLVLASWFMQRAREAARNGVIKPLRNNLLLAGVFTVAFLVGQYLAWQQLSAAGYYISSSPAAAFFLLLTTLHGLHLIGGLVVWMRAFIRSWQGIEISRIKLSVELCTTYWHYLLLVWFVFFALLLTT